jgi:hypothetical protein
MTLQSKLLIQCITDAKLKSSTDGFKLSNYCQSLQEPDSYIRIMLESIATVMDRELKNLNKKFDRKLKQHGLVSKDLI